MSEIYRFIFKEHLQSKEIEEHLYWAVFNAESLFGKPRVRLDGSFIFDDKTKVCVIDKGTDVGQHIAQLFTSYVTQEFGDDAFRVERLDRAEKPRSGEESK